MAADVCLLLIQSLTGDCETAVPIVASLNSLTEQPQIADSPAVEKAPVAIAPIRSSLNPRFGLSGLCGAESLKRSLTCLASAIQKESEHTLQSLLLSAVDVLPAAKADPVAVPIASPTTPVALQIPLPKQLAAMPVVPPPQFSAPTPRRPASGAQLYRQRELSLQAGRLYTRLAPNQFAEEWSRATEQPTYQDWISLLAQEARSAGVGQGNNRLDIVLGDSFGLWLPIDTLPRDRLWLNQSISGDTTAGILRRLSAFDTTRPTTIHLLAGANDLKNHVPEADIVNNLRLAVQRLKQQHPQARIVVYSVLPTRWASIANDRVRSLNTQLASLAQQTAVEFRNMHPQFQDQWGRLRYELTTDGLHLNAQGYSLWRQTMLASI